MDREGHVATCLSLSDARKLSRAWHRHCDHRAEPSIPGSDNSDVTWPTSTRGPRIVDLEWYLLDVLLKATDTHRPSKVQPPYCIQPEQPDTLSQTPIQGGTRQNKKLGRRFPKREHQRSNCICLSKMTSSAQVDIKSHEPARHSTSSRLPV